MYRVRSCSHFFVTILGSHMFLLWTFLLIHDTWHHPAVFGTQVAGLGTSRAGLVLMICISDYSNQGFHLTQVFGKAISDFRFFLGTSIRYPNTCLQFSLGPLTYASARRSQLLPTCWETCTPDFKRLSVSHYSRPPTLSWLKLVGLEPYRKVGSRSLNCSLRS